MVATFLVSRPGHNAATPTWKRQGSLISADALPVCERLFSSPSHDVHDLRERLSAPHQNTNPHALNARGLGSSYGVDTALS
jgi:hypothetical protein